MSHPQSTDNPNPVNPHFQDILDQARLSRRKLLMGVAGLSSLPMVPGMALASGASPTPPASLTFPAVAKTIEDAVSLPPGYRYEVLHATFDRMNSGVAPATAAGREADDGGQRIGDHHDGMELFYVDAQGRYSPSPTDRAVLCVNHESSADAHFLHPNGQTSGGVSGKKFTQFGDWDLGTRPADEVRKEILLHGVSVVEIRRGPQGWRMVMDSPLNRRVTPETAVRIAGPRAHISDIRSFMSTRWDSAGAMSRGTLNNCGTGTTPWGTFLTCEENWAMYFGVQGGAPASGKDAQARKRYGLPQAAPAAQAKQASSQGWHTVSATDDRFSRWNLAQLAANAEQDFRNEANTFGYVLELNPVNPNETPAKRVSLGRFAHEAAVFAPAKPGQPLVVYMGCVSRNEYIYKFVSAAVWDPRDVGGGISVGDKYLNEGQLFAARFQEDGTGEWLPLDIRNPRVAQFAGYAFANQGDVLVNTRLAADAAGATPMDRPEWGAVNPRNGEVYFTLTNNSAANRAPGKTNAANPRAYQDVDGKKAAGNPNGHIIRFRETQDRADALGFRWDVFLFGAEEDAGAANLSGLTAQNAFSSPDGLWFSPTTGICWIQTDDGAMTDESNCMLLAALPGQVGDGGAVTVHNKMVVAGVEQTASQPTFVGQALGVNRLRRFLVAPKGAEVTGICEADGGRTLFVNIQHPGENTKALSTGGTLESQWPGNAGHGPQGRPRSATIMITRTDGGVVGL